MTRATSPHRCPPQTDLHPRGDVVDDADGFAVSVAGQCVGDDVIFHLPGRLRPRLHPIDGFAGGTLQTPILRVEKGGHCEISISSVEPGQALNPSAALKAGLIGKNIISKIHRNLG